MKKQDKKGIKRYLFPILVLAIYGFIFLVDYSAFQRAVKTTVYGMKEMLLIIPPIFVLLGLLDVWVPREVLTKYMGTGSGIKGTAIAFLIGSAAAGPLYGAFPIAAVLMKKGASFFNILIFIGAWSTTKIPMFLFELKSLGVPFALTRLAINIPGIIILAKLISSLLKKEELEILYKKAEESTI